MFSNVSLWLNDNAAEGRNNMGDNIKMIIKRQDVNKIDFDGLKIFDYTSEVEDINSSFAVIEVPSHGRHSLAYSIGSDKYYYIISGQIKFMIDNIESELKTGDFCIIKKGEKFAYKNYTEESVILILFHTPNFNLEDEVFIEK